MFDAREEGREAAYEDFLRTLRREPGRQTEAMLKGIAFERECYNVAEGIDNCGGSPWEPGIRAVAKIIEGAPNQIRVSRDITVGGTEYLLYGILDAVKAGVIYDVKFSSKKFNGVDLAGKYIDSAQHPAYLYMVPEARRFEYLVSDGRELYVEGYDREDTRDIGEIIEVFANSLKSMDLWDVYAEKWAARE